MCVRIFSLTDVHLDFGVICPWTPYALDGYCIGLKFLYKINSDSFRMKYMGALVWFVNKNLSYYLRVASGPTRSATRYCRVQQLWLGFFGPLDAYSNNFALHCFFHLILTCEKVPAISHCMALFPMSRLNKKTLALGSARVFSVLRLSVTFCLLFWQKLEKICAKRFTLNVKVKIFSEQIPWKFLL